MRAHLESLLRTRKLDGTLTGGAPWTRPSDAHDLAATGVWCVDAALDGGLRRGHLSEIVGACSSGRTAVMCRTLAAASARGEVVALLDPSNRFDPASAAGAGLDLERLLWVRDHGDYARALKAMNLVLQAGGFGVVAMDIADAPPAALRAFPFTTWMRIARTVEGSPTVALLVCAARTARSPGGVTIALDHASGRSRVRWIGTSNRARLLTALDVRVRIIGAPTSIVNCESRIERNPGAKILVVG